MLNQHSFIYLLVSGENNIFKIGKADNIISRYEILKSKWGDFNLANSYQIKCNKNNIFKIEKTLHYILKDFNVAPDYQYDGYTEWYDIKCYKDIINLLNSLKNINKDIIDIQQGINIPKKNKSINWQPLSKEKVKRNRKNKQQRNLNTNIENVTILINILNNLKYNIIFFNKQQNFIIFQNIDEDKIDLLFKYSVLKWTHGAFSIIASSTTSKGLTYLDLQFNHFEEKDIINYEEINAPYKKLMTFFNELNFDKIETDISIGYKYKKEQLKIMDRLLDNINIS